MKVSLTDAGKRFNRDWIFRHLNYTFEEGNSYAIIGPNGSGKSTLLQVISGSMEVNEGGVEWIGETGKLEPEKVFEKIAICAPYLELVEEMNLQEFFSFHEHFKPFLPGITIGNIIASIGLEKAVSKQLRYYSSGMKQRVKLAQCIFSNTSLVLLDEPCTNLDKAGIDLYDNLVQAYCKERLVIVSSNDEVEYRFAKHRINVQDFKKF
jgi:ABC-type multidrug transport system ATPase subunit